MSLRHAGLVHLPSGLAICRMTCMKERACRCFSMLADIMSALMGGAARPIFEPRAAPESVTCGADCTAAILVPAGRTAVLATPACAPGAAAASQPAGPQIMTIATERITHGRDLMIPPVLNVRCVS